MSEQQGPSDPYGRPGDAQGWQQQPDPQQGWQQPGPQQPAYGGIQQRPYQGPAGTTSEERNWAMAAHAGSFVAAYFALGFLAPLLVLLVKGKDSAFVSTHAKESLNFGLTVLIPIVISWALIIVLIGFVMLGVIGIFYLIVVIRAAVKASNGEMYRYPLTIRMVS